MAARSSSTAQRMQAQVERERLARAHAEGVAAGLERALQLLLEGTSPAPRRGRPAAHSKARLTRAAAGARKATAPRRGATKPVPKASSSRATPARKAAPAKRLSRKSTRTAPLPAPRRARTRHAASARPAATPVRARRRERAPARARVALPPPPPAAPEGTPGGLHTLLHGAHATALEAALSRVRASRPASAEEKAASGEVLERVRPWVVGTARVEHSRRARHVGLEVEELVTVALGAVHQHLRRFRPGRAGKGRTLFPSWALRVSRQAMWRLVQESRGPVPLTSWGHKLRRRAQRRAQASGMPLREALEEEGASPASVAALERGAVEAVPLQPTSSFSVGMYGAWRSGDDRAEARGEGATVQQLSAEAHAEEESHREQLHLGEAALAALSELPEGQRLAVAGTLGLAGPATPARVLARRMGCTPEEVEALCQAGLAALRAGLEGE